MAEGYDAIFVGSGAPRGRDLDIPGRKEAAANIHIGIDWLSSVSFGHIDKIGKRVIVLGGGNTAMDCCRSSRRLGGEDVKVVVRSGFEEMKASPWEKEDAMHEDIPILNFLVPKEFTHDDGSLTGMIFEKVQGRIRRQGPAQAGPDRRAGRAHRMRRRAGRRRPGERLSLDRARHRHRIRRMGHARGRSRSPCARPTRTCSSAATRPSARRTSSGRWRTATKRRSRSTSSATARTSTTRPPPAVTLVSQKMGIHEWSYDNDVSLDLRFKVPHARQGGGARATSASRSSSASTPSSAFEEAAALPQLRRRDGVRRQALHRMRRLRRHLPDGLHHLHRQRRRKRICAAR